MRLRLRLEIEFVKAGRFRNLTPHWATTFHFLNKYSIKTAGCVAQVGWAPVVCWCFHILSSSCMTDVNAHFVKVFDASLNFISSPDLSPRALCPECADNWCIFCFPFAVKNRYFFIYEVKWISKLIVIKIRGDALHFAQHPKMSQRKTFVCWFGGHWQIFWVSTIAWFWMKTDDRFASQARYCRCSSGHCIQYSPCCCRRTDFETYIVFFRNQLLGKLDTMPVAVVLLIQTWVVSKFLARIPIIDTQHEILPPAFQGRLGLTTRCNAAPEYSKIGGSNEE